MTTNRELEELLEIIMNWSGFYDEAMKALPKETQQFVESTSWAGEAHKAERKKIALSKLQTIIATHDQQLHQALLSGAEEYEKWIGDTQATGHATTVKAVPIQLINKVFNKEGDNNEEVVKK